MSLPARLTAYLRDQHVALLALFLILTGGTAYALVGTNTVYSDDIVEGQVKSADIGRDAVRTTDVRNDALAGGGLDFHDLAAGSVGSSEVADDSLTGNDFDLATLDRVAEADIAGMGRSTVNHTGCSGEGAYVDCASLFFAPPRNTRLLAVASARWGGWYGYCRFLRDGFSQGDVYVGPTGNTSGSSNFAMTRIIDVGTPTSIKFQCKGAGDGFPASYADVQLSVVAIGSM